MYSSIAPPSSLAGAGSSITGPKLSMAPLIPTKPLTSSSVLSTPTKNPELERKLMQLLSANSPQSTPASELKKHLLELLHAVAIRCFERLNINVEDSDEKIRSVCKRYGEWILMDYAGRNDMKSLEKMVKRDRLPGKSVTEDLNKMIAGAMGVPVTPLRKSSVALSILSH